jgi:O-palmitoleoyl-L-serine hydrolase
MKLRTFFSICLCLFSLCEILNATSLTRYTVQNARERHAVCNDGTSAVYYFRKGSGSGSHNWVIYLGGGGFCYSVESCQSRWRQTPELMTSSDKPSKIRLNGLLSDSSVENPDFYNANGVVIPYCSSDLWSGDRAHSKSTGGFEFRGRDIARAVVSDLKKGIVTAKLQNADRVLFAGVSAGGIGVMVHLDWLASSLSNATVKGLNDAGWFPEIDIPFVPTTDKYLQRAVTFWNGKPDASCARDNRQSTYKCFLTSGYPYIKRPMLVQMSQHDSIALGAVGVHPPLNAWERSVADLFAHAVRDSLTDVSAAFSPRSFTHGLSPYTKFHTRKIDGLSLRDVTGNFFFERSGPVKLIQ